MIGKKFGRLTVLEELPERKHRNKVYKCQCECGNITNVIGTNLRSGKTKSCGCLYRKSNAKPGKSYTRLYHILKGMKDRCYRASYKYYTDYGGRGIVICQEWLNNFMTFYNWAMNNGYRDGLTIDRIDTNGNYEPSNCCWVTQKQQCNNKRNCVYITYNDKTQTVTQWADELHCNRSTIYVRHRNGWTDEECLFGKGVNHEMYKL